MKKLFTLMAICLGSFTAANAQYTPEKGDIGVEVGFTPFNMRDGESFKLNEGMLKARYFINEKNAIRLKLGLGIDNTTDTWENNWNPSDTKGETAFDAIIETKTKQTSFSIMLGYERHLFTKGRFDVYAGLELGYQMYKCSGSATFDYQSTSYDNDNNRTKTVDIHNSYDFNDYAGDFEDNGKGGYNTDANGFPIPEFKSQELTPSSFVGNLFAGVDFYVYKKLYLGAEIGLSFKTGKVSNYYLSGNTEMTTTAYNTSGTVKQTIVDKETFDYGEGTSNVYQSVDGVTKVDQPYDHNTINRETSKTSFKFYVEPAIRLGWTF